MLEVWVDVLAALSVLTVLNLLLLLVLEVDELRELPGEGAFVLVDQVPHQLVLGAGELLLKSFEGDLDVLVSQ